MDTKYVLKEIPQDWSIRNAIYERVRDCPNVRRPVDSVPCFRTLVFDFLDAHLLQFAQRDIPPSTVKSILKQVLQGLAAMHKRDVMHNGMWLLPVTGSGFVLKEYQIPSQTTYFSTPRKLAAASP